MSVQEGDRPSRPSRPRGPHQDAEQQAIRVRRLVAGGVGLLLLILIFIGIKGCLGAQKDSAFKEYSSDVNALIEQSNANDKAVFDALSKPTGPDALDVQDALNTARVDSEDLVSRLKGTDHPDELNSAQNWLVQTFEFRSEAIAKIADAVPKATSSKDSQASIDAIAAEMQGFVASDVTYQARFVPDFSEAYKDAGIDRVPPKSQALPSVQWLEPKYVQTQLGKAGGKSDQAATPGLHGTSIESVSVGDIELAEGETTQVSAPEAPTFEVTVLNGGDSDESNIEVTVKAGNVTAKGTIAQIATQETATVSIPLKQAPPTDGQTTVTVDVAAVPGEELTDNNTATYDVVFTK